MNSRSSIVIQKMNRLIDRATFLNWWMDRGWLAPGASEKEMRRFLRRISWRRA